MQTIERPKTLVIEAEQMEAIEAPGMDVVEIVRFMVAVFTFGSAVTAIGS